MDGAPLNYLTGAGLRAYPVVWLTWGLLVISCLVVLIIAFLVWQGARRRRSPAGARDESGYALVQRPSTGLEWIYVGVGISSIVLLGSAVWTMYALAAVATPPSRPAFTIEITAHQWWWEARYLPEDPGSQPSQIFTTANELHVPVGKPVRIRLKSADVIHSFWVPALTGKTDAIPGQLNETWLEADKTGTYLGQCTEYCGKQHAHMALRVIAEAPKEFHSWRDNQLAAAPTPASGSEIAKGQAIFESRCGGCHRVRGTLAGGVLGPDLTHLMSRHTIAAGTVPNEPGYLSAWIADPQSIKPGTQMPALELSGPELQALRTFLRTLS